LEEKEYRNKYGAWEKDKKNPKPDKPNLKQTIIKDSTIEMGIKYFP
jgi:hypothetical protein